MCEDLVDIKYFRGSDASIEMKWLDKNGDDLRPEDLVDYKVSVCHENDLETPLLVFEKSDADNLVNIIDNATGVVELYFDREFTKTAKYGKYYFYTQWHFLDETHLNNERVEVYSTLGLIIIK